MVGKVAATGTGLEVAFGSATEGWVLAPTPAGSAPIVFRTTDAGVSWRALNVPLPPPTGQSFTAMQAVDGNTVVLTNGSALDGGTTPDPAEPRLTLVTRDGGQIWFYRTFEPVHITPRGVMYGLAGGEVLRSTNYAQLITRTALDASAKLLRVAFFGENDGLVIGRTDAQPFVVWRTRDGGLSWTKLDARGLPTDPLCKSAAAEHRLSLSSADTAQFEISKVTTCAAILRSVDGGSSWAALATPQGN
ncbi:hypothetical protein ABXN37_26080 [Piscinibacter sakaiensis]|uniref:hypothetical protein n=1 Tax=Piscinibacter sakaiensis TaxID=1547922 RepID=UPI0037286170